MGFGTVNVGQAQAENNNYLTNEQVGVAGGLATLGGDGKLTESQRPVIDAYTKAQTDGKSVTPWTATTRAPQPTPTSGGLWRPWRPLSRPLS